MSRKISRSLDDAAKGIVRITAPIMRDVPKIGRNERCWCGSGLKYKKCCWLTEQEYLSGNLIEEAVSKQDKLEDMDIDQLREILDEGEEE